MTESTNGYVEICNDMECVILNETGYAITEHVPNQKKATHIKLETEYDAWIDGGERRYLLNHYSKHFKSGCEF